MYSLRLIPLGYSIRNAGNKQRAPYLNLLVYVKWPGNVRELKDFRIRPRHIWEKLNLDLGKRHGGGVQPAVTGQQGPCSWDKMHKSENGSMCYKA